MKLLVKTAAEIMVRVALAGYSVVSRLRDVPPRRPVSADSVDRILVIRLDLLGDAVFSRPAVEAMVAAFPRAEIDLLLLPYTAPILRDLPGVRRVIELDVNAYRRLVGLKRLRELWATIRGLRAERYDLAFSLSRWMGGLFAVLSGARLRAGPAAETYWGCYNVPLRGSRYAQGQHEVEFCLDLVRQLTAVPAPSTAPSLLASTAPLNDFGLIPPYVVLLPGASNGSAKRWPPRYWAELAELVERESQLSVVLCGTAADRVLLPAGAVSEGRQVNLLGRTSVEELVAVLGGAEAVIGGDTGPLHVAAALGRPVIGMYGPTDPDNTGPRGARSQVLRAGLPCSPCYDLRSPAECKLPDRSVACMWGVKPRQVLAAVLDAAATARPPER